MTKVNVHKSTEIKPNTIHKIGNMYLEKATEEIYILCLGTTNGMSMISLMDGYRWGEPYPVVDIDAITQAEFDIITEQMNDPDDFVLLNAIDITVIQ